MFFNFNPIQYGQNKLRPIEEYIKNKYNYNIRDEVIKEWYNDRLLTEEQMK